MSFKPSQENSSQRSKTPIVIASVGVLALAVAGGVVWTQKGAEQQAVVESTEIMETANMAADNAADVAPAANEDAATENAANETPADETAVSEIRVGDPVVAKIGEQDVMRSEVLAFITTLPEQVRQQMPLDMLFPLALDQVLNNKIIGAKAEEAELANDPEVTRMLDQAKDNIVRNIYIERELTKSISDKELQDSYQAMLDGMEKVEEARARHILVADEQTAREIIAKLDDGESFEELAQESTDTATAVNGGDLGYFSKTDMIPEFSEAAFNLAPGAYSKEPVQSQFGYHVIKLEDKRQRPEPAFEAVKPQLEAQLRREKLNHLLENWQQAADIQKFDINGDPLPVSGAEAPAEQN